MLTDSQIINLAERMDIPLEGVYFKDELPKQLKPNKAYIINLQDSIDEEGNDNSGTHWTYLQIGEYKNKAYAPIFFDPYGAPPSESIKAAVQRSFKKYLPYTNKDVQSLMNNACGFYCLALGHYINAYPKRSGDIYLDVGMFLDYFEDLNKAVDWKKNEYILKHFFQSSEPSLRNEIDVIKPIESISSESEKGQADLVKMSVDVKYISKNK
jgi:hypothetical protein